MTTNLDTLNQDRLTSTSDLDISLALRALIQKWPLLFLSALTLGALTYYWSRSQAPVYQAEAVVLATNSSNGSGIVDQTLITAPPLPDGAANQALHSPAVVNLIIQELRTVSGLKTAERTALVRTLSDELKRNSITSLDVIPQLNPYGNGLYIIQGKAPTATSARILTDIAVSKLIKWDASRATEGIQRSAETIRAQLADIDRQVQEASDNGIERRTLLQSRASLQENLARVSIMLKAATGTLTPVSPAAQPFRPIAPRPLQNGLLGAILGLVLSGFILATRALLDKTVKSEDDLIAFDVPTLGIIPKLGRREVLMHGIINQGKSAGLYEAVGFLRVNLFALLPDKKPLKLTISSTAPGEGKSSMIATLAHTLAATGKTVLIIDGDLRRGTQLDIWEKYSGSHEWKQLIGTGGHRTFQEALEDPQSVQVLSVSPGVDMLPAGPGLNESLARLTQLDLGHILELWSQPYDVVLVDTPPVLALADGLVVARHTDGLLLVVEARVTTIQAIRAAVRRIGRSDLNLLGFVLNKADIQRDNNYMYSYGTNGAHKLD